MRSFHLLADFYAYRLFIFHASHTFFSGQEHSKFAWGVGAKEAKVLGCCVSAGTSRSRPSPSPGSFRLKIQSQQLTIS